MLTVLTQPQQTALTTLARLKAQLAIATTTDDAAYTALIPPVSDAVRSALGYEPARRQVEERFAGHGFEDHLARSEPIVSLGTVAFDGDAVDTADQEVAILRGAILRRAARWTASVRPLWTVQLWSGWLLPGDDGSLSDVTFAASGQTLTTAAGTWPLLVAGDRVTISGAGESANNGTFTVASRTASVLTFETGSGIVDEASGATVAYAVRSLPQDIERAAIVLIRDAFRERGGSGTVKSEESDFVKVTYEVASDFSAEASSEAARLLAPYARRGY